MGRPINKKFFGNLNYPYDNEQTGGNSGTGGESINTITVSNSGTLYSQGSTVSVGAPNIAGGIPATISYSINASGNIAVSVVNTGTGYTSAPSISVAKATTVTPTADATNNSYTLTNVSSVAGVYVGMRIDGAPGVQASTYVASVGTNTITLTNTMTASTTTNAYAFSDQGASFSASTALTSNTQNAIAFISYLTTGSSAISGGDIIKQESSRRYLVRNAQGVGQVKLSAGTGTSHTLEAGGMHIIATDFGGATYYVIKLTSRKATLINRTGTDTALVTLTTDADGVKTGTAGWTLGSATGTVVTIANV